MFSSIVVKKNTGANRQFWKNRSIGTQFVWRMSSTWTLQLPCQCHFHLLWVSLVHRQMRKIKKEKRSTYVSEINSKTNSNAW